MQAEHKESRKKRMKVGRIEVKLAKQKKIGRKEGMQKRQKGSRKEIVKQERMKVGQTE